MRQRCWSRKEVVDYNVKVRVTSDNAGVEIANVVMGTNHFDQIAVKEAVCMKEKGVVTPGKCCPFQGSSLLHSPSPSFTSCSRVMKALSYERNGVLATDSVASCLSPKPIEITGLISIGAR